MQISKLNQQELIVQTKVAVQAVLTVPELTEAFKQAGITTEKVKVGSTLIREVNKWQDQQAATTKNVRSTQRAFRAAKDTISSLYYRHLEAARFLYREDEDMQYALQLLGSRKTRYAAWFEQVRAFYTQIDAQKLEPFGVNPKEVNEVKKLLEKLAELQVLRNDAKRQSQQTTQQKQLAVNDLRNWFRRFINAAKFVSQDDPQLLESMGVVVPAN